MAGLEHIIQKVSGESYSLVIANDLSQATALRKRLAARDECFGITVATFEEWFTELWELYGDGRELIEASRRRALVRRVLEAKASESLRTQGMTALVARMIDKASGLAEFEAAVEAAGSRRAGTAVEAAGSERAGSALSPTSSGRAGAALAQTVAGRTDGAFSETLADCAEEEWEILGCIDAYRGLAEALGFVEPGDAMRLLVDVLRSEGACLGAALCAVAPAPPLQRRRFLDALVSEGVLERVDYAEAERDVASAVRAACAAGMNLRFAFPSGRYAASPLIGDLIRERADAGPLLVLSPDAAKSYEELAPLCASTGLSLASRARLPFFETDFGRDAYAARRCLTEDATVADIADLLLSPYSGVSRGSARELDRDMRSDRLKEPEACCGAIAAANDAFGRLLESVESVDATVLLGCMEDMLRSGQDVDEAYRSTERAAITALGALFEKGRDLLARFESIGLEYDESELVDWAMRELESTFVDASSCTLVSESPQVVVASLRDAPNYEAGRFETVILCDATAASYPAASRVDAGSLLLERLGLPYEGEGALRPADERLEFDRMRLCAALGLEPELFVIARPLFDTDANPTYPAVIVQELVNAFREDTTVLDDIDNPFALPPVLQEGLVQRGEEFLFANSAMRPRESVQTRLATFPVKPFGLVEPESRPRVVLPRVSKGGKLVKGLYLSPSQIESYLDCPGKWFAVRRLKLEDLDEDFGNLQMGEFAHRALEIFYRRFQEELGAEKLTRDLLGPARELMAEVLETLEAHQFELDSKDNRLVPVSELEQRELDSLKRKLIRFLDFEVQLLPGFHPAYLEYSIQLEDKLSYAGHGLIGTIDRIDVDGKGNAVIVDYKGSIGADYKLRAKDREEARRVQALIYAKAVQELLGLKVVGAVYVCYGRRRWVVGAYDPFYLGPDDLPGIKAEDCVAVAREGIRPEDAFQDLIRSTEERVAAMLERMLSGDVTADPLDESSCTYCPVVSCAARL